MGVGYTGGESYRGGGLQMRAATGHVDYNASGSSHMYQNPGSLGQGGLAMQGAGALPNGSEIFLHHVRFQQSDGCMADESTPPVEETAMDQLPFRCPSAAANRRMPRKGDVSNVITVAVSVYVSS